MHRVLGTRPLTSFTPEIDEKLASVAGHDAAIESAAAIRPAIERPSVVELGAQVSKATRLAPLRTGLALACADLVAACCCFGLAWTFAWLLGLSTATGVALPAAICVAIVACNGAVGLYPGIAVNPIVETRQIVVSASAVFVAALALLWAAEAAPGATLLLALAWLSSIVLLPIGRMMGRALFSQFRWWTQPIVVIGNREVAQQCAARLRRWRTLGLDPIGHVDIIANSSSRNGDLHPHRADRLGAGLSHNGSPGRPVDLAENRNAQWAILATPASTAKESAELLAAAQHFPNVLVFDETSMLPSLWSRPVDVDGYCGRHCQRRVELGLPPAWHAAKRTFDIVAAVCMLLGLLPVFLLVAVLIRLSSPGPVFYSQERVGRGGRPFRAWKFRTMVLDADRVLADYLQKHPELREEWTNNHKLKIDPRVIPGIGRVLRNFSLDELPQLWNVLCGEMSLVGPRPIVEEEIPKYQDEFATYVQVTPGVTGLWQISGRNNTTYARRVYLDSYYVLNWSPWLDYYILLRTLKTVALREGAY